MTVTEKNIDADAGKGLKTFDSLVLAKTSEAQADKINELSHAYYGVAGIAWLEHITTDKAATTATAGQLVGVMVRVLAAGAAQAWAAVAHAQLVAGAATHAAPRFRQMALIPHASG